MLPGVMATIGLLFAGAGVALQCSELAGPWSYFFKGVALTLGLTVGTLSLIRGVRMVDEPMTDHGQPTDILTRLRHHQAIGGLTGELFRLAADEIERMRAEVARLEGIEAAYDYAQSAAEDRQFD